MKRVIVLFLFIFIVISIPLDSNAFRFPRRNCVPYRRVSLIYYLQLLNKIKNQPQSFQDSFVERILTKPRVKLSTVEEIISKGYNASTHTILSKDGYFTTVDRISGGILSPPRKGKQAVLLFHGSGGIGSNWIIQPGSRNLAFLLADAGYEVWLANGRGSSASMKHTHLNPDRDISYWNFSFEEQEKPELNKKFKASFLLAPGTFVRSGYGLVINLGLWLTGTLLEEIVNRILMGRFRVQPEYIITPVILDAIFGDDSQQFNHTNFRNALEKGFDNGVLRPPFHVAQNFKSCRFQRYDYGRRGNLIKYGKTQPPTYNLDGMTVPTYIFYGESDNLVTPWVINYIINLLCNFANPNLS
ncbi:unnamed protein product [Orchesella dallaii]|uniref:Partial AB-hydrolase lipase domain-containing protein n=1 Tax=Orchesella dallaii TaxID=48710 RepID=A0ABP1R6U0_9HEXA